MYESDAGPFMHKGKDFDSLKCIRNSARIVFLLAVPCLGGGSCVFVSNS